MCVVRDPTPSPSPPGHLTPLLSNINGTPPTPRGGSWDSPRRRGQPQFPVLAACFHRSSGLGGRQTLPNPHVRVLLGSGVDSHKERGVRCVGAGRRGSGCAPSWWPPWAAGPGQECDWVPT